MQSWDENRERDERSEIRFDDERFSRQESMLGDLFQMVELLADMQACEYLSEGDIKTLQWYVDHTYSGKLTVHLDREGEFCSLPGMISKVEAISTYRDDLDEYHPGPWVRPDLLPEAIETFLTLGKRVVGIYDSPDETLESAVSGRIYFIPGGGRMTYEP